MQITVILYERIKIWRHETSVTKHLERSTNQWKGKWCTTVYSEIESCVRYGRRHYSTCLYLCLVFLKFTLRNNTIYGWEFATLCLCYQFYIYAHRIVYIFPFNNFTTHRLTDLRFIMVNCHLKVSRYEDHCNGEMQSMSSWHILRSYARNLLATLIKITKTFIRITGLWTEIKTRELPSTKKKCQTFVSDVCDTSMPFQL